jgi:hypothetical protein
MEDDEIREMFEGLFDPEKFNFSYDIEKAPEALRPVLTEQIVQISSFILDALEEDGKLMEMLLWPSEKIKAYELTVLKNKMKGM